jgi:uncharacterized protein YgiM (DUF1202 family)
MNIRFWMIPTLLIFTIWLAGCGLVGFEEEKERPQRLDVSAWPTAVPATPPPIPTPFPKTTVSLDPTPEPLAEAAVAGSTTAPEIQASLDFSGSLTELAEQVRILTGGLTPVGAAFVTVEGSTVRQGPGESFDALDTLGQGDITALLGLNADNDWLYVVTQSLVQGWLPVDAVRVTGGLAAAPVLSAEQLATAASQTDIPALANTANVDLPSSPTTSVFAKLNPVAAAFLTVDSSPLYNRPSTSSTSVASLEQGEVAGVLGKDASGEWLFVVTVDLEFGWMPADRLRTVGALEEARVLPPDPIAAFAGPAASAAPAAASGSVSAGQTIEINSLAPVETARVRTAALNLRQRPGADFKLLDTLAQADEVSILALNRDQQWALLKTAGDQFGWGSIAFLDVDGSLAGAPQVRTLTPDETYPADQAAPIVALSAVAGAAPAASSVGNTVPAAVSAVSSTGSGDSGPSAPSGTLAPIASATVAEKVDMRRGPGQEFGPVAAVTVDEPVSIHGTNAQRDWVVVTATNGRAGWVPLATLSVAGSLPEVPPILTAWVDSNDIEVKTGPGIFYDSAGKLAINNLVSVIGLNDGRNWALVETLPGGLGWIPIRFLTISGSLANVPQIDTAALAGAGNVPAEPDLPVPSGPPSGKLALQTSSGGDIMLVNADGTGLRRLTSGIDPALSPDGQKVAFTRWEGATGTLWEINVDGTGERPILGETRKAKGPEWSPDGSQIVLNFQHGGRLEEKVDCLALKGRPNIPRNATNVRLGFDRGAGSPELCYDLPPDPEWGLRVVDVAAGSFEDLFGGYYAFRPAWDPNQPWRVVSDSGSGLLAVDVNRAEFRQPLTDKVEDGAPAFSPDGRFIAFVTDVQGGNDIFRVNSDGSGRIRLTQTPLWVPVQPDSDGKQWNNVSPTWSPDGSQIAFLTDRTGRWEIWIMNADGANQQPMFPADIANQLEIAYDFVDERVLSWR